jgi:hypothetical protein
VRDIAELPAGSAPRVLQSFDADASGAHDPDASGARALFEGLGYSPEREYLHMGIDVADGFDPGGAPTGITIRPRLEADDPAIVAVMADAFQEPWDYEEARQEFLVSAILDPSLWLIALDGDQAVGALFATSRTDADRSARSSCVMHGGSAASPGLSCERRSRCSATEVSPKVPWLT